MSQNELSSHNLETCDEIKKEVEDRREPNIAKSKRTCNLQTDGAITQEKMP